MANGRGAKHADFIGIPRKVANSWAFKSLPPIGRALYVDLRRQYNGHNNGQISAVMEGTEDRPGLSAYGWPARSVFKHLKTLLEHHLIEKTRQGGIAAMSKVCSLYAFTDMQVVANKEKGIAGSMASLAYLNFTQNERPPRTREKKSQGARGAYIGARGACTQVHAVPTDGATTARGAGGDFASKVTQPDDTTAVFDDPHMESGIAPTSAPRAVPYNLAKGRLAIPATASRDAAAAALDLDVDLASRGEKSGAQPEKSARRSRNVSADPIVV